MGYAVKFREELPPVVADEFDSLAAYLKRFFNIPISAPLSDLQGLVDAINAANAASEKVAHKDLPNGYAGLDGSSKLSGTEQRYGTTANTACQGNDSRLTDARPPSPHAASHAAGGSDPVTLAESQITNLTTDLAAKALGARQIISGGGLVGGGDLTADRTLAVGAGTGITVNADDIAVNYGTTAITACAGNDSRLTDARTPTAHATSHKSGGTDAIKLDELAAPTNVTTLNVSTTAHGLAPILPNSTAKFFDGTGAYSAMTRTGIFFNAGTIAAASTVFIGPAGQNATEANVRMVVPFAGVMKNLYIVTDGVAGVGQTFTYTLRKNGGDGTVTTVMTGGAATTANDTTHSDIVVAGDVISLKVVTSAGAGAVHHSLSWEIASA